MFLYQGLAHSYNLSTARLGLEVGVPNVLKTPARLGVTREFPAFPSMLLGAGGLTPIEVAAMYQTLANGGFNTPMRGIRSVLTADGEPLKRYPFQVQQRFDPASIYLIQSAMQRVMREGTGSSVYNVLPRTLTLAGKTGTSNDSRDSWFAGFSQDLLAVVWLDVTITARRRSPAPPVRCRCGRVSCARPIRCRWICRSRTTSSRPGSIRAPDKAPTPIARAPSRCRIFAAANRRPAQHAAVRIPPNR